MSDFSTCSVATTLRRLAGSLLVGLVAACGTEPVEVTSESAIHDDSLAGLAKRGRKGGEAPTDPPTSSPATVDPDDRWAGINANTGWLDMASVSYVDQVNQHAGTLGTGIVRMGTDGLGGRRQGAAFSWAGRDRVVDQHRAGNLVIHAVIDPIDGGAMVDVGGSAAEHEANWRYFCDSVMTHYRGKIGYYIIDNEPDFFSQSVPPSRFVTFTRIAYEAARRVAPDGSIKIESPPTTSPGSTYLRDMINLGITRYADYVGVHGYGSQINDEHSFTYAKPWEWMQASGYPVRPVANSENGTSRDWNALGLTWQARWFRLNALQLKRYGYDHTLLYSIRSTAPSFNIADWNGSQIVPVQPTYDAVRAAYVKRPFGNGGFEDPNDRELEWVVYYWIDNVNPPEWQRAEFVRTADGQARSGTGYLRFDTGESGSPNRVRRVAEHLTPGRQYTLSAWVKISGGGTATLRALGYNHLNGTQQSAASTSTRDTWQQLSVTFTPSKTWVVIELAGTGTSGGGGHVMRWDDVSLQ